MAIHLATPIEKLARVGKVTAGRFAYLGIHTVKDLLEHYPHRFEDYTAQLPLDALQDQATGTIQGTITSIQAKKTSRKKMILTEAYIENETGSLKIVWFNQPYIAETLKTGDVISVAGTVTNAYNEWSMTNPSYEKVTDHTTKVHTGGLIPIYPLTAGLTQKQIRFLMHQALEATTEYTSLVPDSIQKEEKLLDKPSALTAVHAPQTQEHYLQGNTTLKFEELFVVQILVQQAKKRMSSLAGPSIMFNEAATKALVASLPFSLTDDQKKAAWNIIQDMQEPHPMNRLLQGDVGSGKTVVASLAALNAAHAGYQTALMAPTEILAMQHYHTIAQLFPEKSIALITSKYARCSTDPEATRTSIKASIESGDIPISIGTHSMIQKEVVFKQLGLVIIDEQHRFGVDQRKELKSKTHTKNTIPHFLSMTATPIPRTLALTLYGDLAISTIRQMPKDRKKIITNYVPEKGRTQAYQFMQEQINEHRQIFVVCPLIEESDALGVASATQEYEKLNKKVFKKASVALLHGKMKSDEKEKIMQDFKEGKTDVLVSTAVVEVGVDIPNATVMMIEGADRFGLSQLHQFRGRVGRSEHQSYCFLFSDNGSIQTKQRLEAFTQAPDGFAIAELDLSLRGHGQLYGTEQSGHTDQLNIATLADSVLIEKAQQHVHKLLTEDPDLETYPLLKHATEKESERLHFE